MIFFPLENSNDASSMLESPSSSVGSLDPASPRMRSGGDNNGGFYVTMTPLNSNSKVSVSKAIQYTNLYKYFMFVRHLSLYE